MRTSHHIANTIIEHRHDEAWLRQHIHNDAHYASLMAVIREKEETLKQRVIRALAGFSGYGRVMVVGGGAEIVAPATGCAKAHGLMQIIRSLQIQVAEVFVLQVLLWKLLAPAAQ